MRNLDRTFFALSDPTRRRILELLAADPARIGELAQPFGLTLNGVKKHVRVLEDAELVITEKVGRARECRLGPAELEDVARWIAEYRNAWQGRLDRFGTYVEQTNAQRRNIAARLLRGDLPKQVPFLVLVKDREIVRQHHELLRQNGRN